MMVWQGMPFSADFCFEIVEDFRVGQPVAKVHIPHFVASRSPWRARF